MSTDHYRRSPRYPDDVMMRLEGAARVGWAKFYEQVRENEALRCANAALTDRVETLLAETRNLVDHVLHARNPRAFAQAYRLDRIIREFDRGRRQ